MRLDATMLALSAALPAPSLALCGLHCLAICHFFPCPRMLGIPLTLGSFIANMKAFMRFLAFKLTVLGLAIS